MNIEDHLDIPNSEYSIRVGDNIQIGRFSTESYIVSYGWYEYGGNREVCGWYLVDSSGKVRPIQKIDLYDIYMIS